MGEARLTFLATLRAGLRGAPPNVAEDMLADYAAHFDEGARGGRSEEEVAAALGDPLALAEELLADMRIRTWEAKRTPGAALKVVTSVLGLGVLNLALVFVVTPVLCLLVLALIVLIPALIAFGVWLLLSGASLGAPGGVAVTLLAGVSMIAAAVALTALAALGAIGLVSALGRHARLHYRLIPRLLRTGTAR